jgi:hypothetical protein
MRCGVFCLIFFALFSLGNVASIRAEVLAVFPIEDLGQGKNGVNLEVSDYLGWEMDKRGFDVVAGDAVVAFMARHRMRWLGFMDTGSIVAAKEELGVDLILFGNVTPQQGTAGFSSLGLTLYLIRTEDTRNIWTGSAGLSSEDIVHLLGINEAAEKEGLLAALTQKVLSTWPEDLGGIAPLQAPLEIDGYDLQPEYVQRGERVFCTVTLRTSWANENMPRVFFKAAGKVYRATIADDNKTYSNEWVVAEADGRYPVTMVVNWPSGQKKVAYLGAYWVDNTAPQVVLDLKGVKLEGTVAFRNEIIIVPRMLRREPVARWELKVSDELGVEQMSTYGYGNLPMRFVWNGLGQNNWPVEEGVYRVSLQVWDKANNISETFEPVAVARTPPTMVLEAKNRGRDMLVDLSNEGAVPVAFWRMEMRDGEGAVIKVAEGEELPVRIDLNRPGRTIRVADDLQSPSKTIKVADQLRPPSKTIKVAEQLRPPSKTIKVAERLRPPEKSTTIKVAEGDQPQLDGFRPEDNDKRKVEATIIIRDILGNVRKEVITDLYGYFDQKERALEALQEPTTKPVWMEDF